MISSKTISYVKDDVKLAINLIEEGNLESGLAILKERLKSREVLPEVEAMEVGAMLKYPASIHMKVRNKAKNLMMKYINRHYIVSKKGNEVIVRRFK